MTANRSYRFGPFELRVGADIHLTKHGTRLRLPKQPLEVLLALVEANGSVVTREDLRARLWPQNHYVNFEHGLNVAVRKLRDALCDTAQAPRYVDTLPGKGYRLLVPVTFVEESEAEPISPDEMNVPKREQQFGWRTMLPIAIAVLVVSTLGWVGWKYQVSRLKLQPHDYVLIADFENRTGDLMLDGLIDTALRRELANSTYINVAPSQRVNDALNLMRKPTSSRLDADTAREVCLRDGGIKAILNGRLQKIGPTYEITIFLVNPADGRTISSISETAQDESTLYQSIRSATDAVRRRLGENAVDVRASGQKLERVTTPSLQALQLYSQGERAGEEGQWPEAEQLFRRALVSDPQFASALNMLAWSLHNQQGKYKREEWLDATEKANQLADTVSEREANFIRGTYFHFRGDLDRAIAAYKAVLDVYPDDPWCVNNVFALERSRGNDAAAYLWAQRIANSRPNSPSMIFWLWATAMNRGDISVGRRYEERLKKLDEAGALTPSMKTILAWQPALEKAGNGDVSGALKEVERLIVEVDAGRLQRRAFAAQAVFFFPAIGKMEEAEKWARVADQERPGPPFGLEAIAARVGDGGQKLVEVTDQIRLKYPDNLTADIYAATDLAHAGRCGEALAAIRRIPEDRTGAWTDWIKGEIQRCEGNFPAATASLKEATRHAETGGDRSGLFFVSESLARTLDAQGDTAAAIAVLEPIERDPRFDVRQGNGPTEARFYLSTLYRKSGRLSEAKKVEAELLSLLRMADPGFPPLAILRNRTSR